MSPVKNSSNKFEKYKIENDIKLVNELKEFTNLSKTQKSIDNNQIRSNEKTFQLKKLDKDNLGESNWKKNMEHKKEWEQSQNMIDNKEANFFKDLVLDSFKQGAKENENQIENFEKNLARLGLDITTIDPKLKKIPKAQMSSEMIIQKIKEKMSMNNAAKKERERRQRKIMVDQAKALEELDRKKEDNENLNEEAMTMAKISTYDRQKDYENWRVFNERTTKNLAKKAHNEKLLGEMNKNYDEIFKTGNFFSKENFFEKLHKEDYKIRLRELNKKKQKREKNLMNLQNIFNLILEITEEAFNHQNQNNTDLIDLKDWRNWSQMFINNQNVIKNVSYFDVEKPIVPLNNAINTNQNSNALLQNTLNVKEDYFIDKTDRASIMPSALEPKHNTFTKMNFTRNLSAVLEITLPEIESAIDECELFDYINFIGQWKKSLIPQSSFITLKINEVLNQEFFLNYLPQKKAIGYSSGRESISYEPRDDDLENLTIPKIYNKSIYLSEIIDLIIDLKFNEKNKEDNTKSLLAHVPIKIAMIGHSFCGKKTQAKLLNDTFSNLKVYVLSDIIKKNIEILERLETPIEANPKYKTLKKNQIDQLVSERQQEEAKFAEMRKLIAPLRDSMKSGDAPSDELLLNLLMEYIKQDFTEKAHSQIVEEILAKNRKRKEINEELAKIKEEQLKKPKAKVKEEQQFIAELAKLNVDNNKGFIVLDFPNNIEQARLFENRITGFIQEIEKPKTPGQMVKESYAMVLDKLIKPNSSKNYRQGALDMIFCLEVPSKECIRRAIGRRIDPNTGNIYHLEDNPPNPNDHKLFDRLQPLEDSNMSETRLKKKHLEFDFSLTGLTDFYESFGFYKYSLKTFNIINANKSKEQLAIDLSEYIKKLSKINEEKENDIILNNTTSFKSLDQTDRTSQNNNILNMLNPKSVDQNYNNNNNISIHENREDKIQENISAVQPLDEDDFSKYYKRLEEAKKKFSMNTIEGVYHNWAKTFENYTMECRSVFKNVRKQREFITSNFSKLQVKFVDFLKRPSKKLIEVHKYQNKYNKFADEYPELKDDPQVKEEFHQDVVDLSDRIWEIIEVRKNEAIEERKKIMQSGWIENEMEKCYSFIERLIITEVEKFVNGINIIRDFYNIMDSKSFPELNNSLVSINETLKEDLNGLSLENDKDSENFPKVEKLFKNCIKLIFKYEDKIKNIEKLLKQNLSNSSLSGDSNNKKVTRNIVYKKINHQVDQTFTDEKREIFIYEEEMKNALKYEKMKFKYRINAVKFWGINSLKNMRRLANIIFDKLDDWIIITIKSENEAMNSLTSLLRNLIEREAKVRVDFELDVFDIYNMIDITEHMESVPIPMPFKEIKETARFNLTKFKGIFDEIKTFEIQKNFIKTSSFVQLYFKKYLIESENDGIPASLRKLSFHNYFRFIKYFEINNVFLNNQQTVRDSMINEKYSSTVSIYNSQYHE